jgi:NADH-quinone oxidoreductase subunit G
MSYRWLNRGDRIEAPLVLEGGRHAAVDWDTALDRFGAIVGETTGPVVLLASGLASVESLGLVRMLLEGATVGRSPLVSAVKVPLGPEAPLAGIPNLALRQERIPNLYGATLLGYGVEWDAALEAASRAALVVLLDVQPDAADLARLAGIPGKLVVLGTVFAEELRAAELVLPVTTMAEENGTYINRDGRVQRYNQAKSQPGMARPAWWVAGEVIAGPGPDADAPASAAQAFAILGRQVEALGGLSYGDLGFTGRVLPVVESARQTLVPHGSQG